MSNRNARNIFDEILESLDVPDSAYEKAEKRYADLGKWFDGPTSECAQYSPHIYPQGSFRLGTVNRPLVGSFDLDLGCRLRTGITKATHTQFALKSLVGCDLEAYRKARQIEAALDEKTRCWRLEYQDDLAFHMDIVPSIPENAVTRFMLKEAMVKFGSADVLADQVAAHAGSITDNTHPNFKLIAPDWRVSNSEGYALWFESRMELSETLLESRQLMIKAAKVDKLPARKWKSPLQYCVQLLKRHRDVMYTDAPDGAPISVIITTLAAAAYRGEADVAGTLERVLDSMAAYVRQTIPRVPNPVNPAEDFADKWHNPKHAHLNLEGNFWDWLEQAQTDFRLIAEARDADHLADQVREKLAVTVNRAKLQEKLGFPNIAAAVQPKTHAIPQTPAKPWSAE